jgi:glycosyltransferase involved in cell wall biosynthesis
MNFSIICLSPQDWDIDLPTNRQQIMLRAAARGHDVLFVETGDFLGKLLWRIARGPGRVSLARRLFTAERVAPRIDVVRALNVLPWGQKYATTNAVNSFFLRRRLRRRLGKLAPPVVLWIYDPATARMSAISDVAFSVYDCVDDYAEQAGGDARRRRLIERSDTLAASRARLVFATSKPLFERMSTLNNRTHLVENVGDYAHFQIAADRAVVADELRELPRPIFGFAGNMLSTKVDFALLGRLAASAPAATILLVGPERAESREALAELAARPNVKWVGMKPYAELPRYVAAFDVALIPYLENRYTRSCFPLKVYEYLAAGKPVVAKGLPALEGLDPDVVLARDAGDFVAAAHAALERRGETAAAQRMQVAARNTWDTRTERLLGLVDAELAVAHG